jgi:hypothetical protein
MFFLIASGIATEFFSYMSGCNVFFKFASRDANEEKHAWMLVFAS